MTGRFALLCFLPLLPGTRALAQGPISGFPTPKGEKIFALTYSSDRYDTYLLPDDATEERDIETISYSLFTEVGLTENTAFVATLPYMRTNDGEGSLQDASAWIKYMNLDRRAGRGAHRVFTAVGLSFPVGNYEVNGVDAIGQRASVFQGRLAYQYQHDAGWFLNAQTGIDFQFAPESLAAWPVLLRSGYGGKYFYIEGWLEFVTALESENALQTAQAGTGSDWRRVGTTLYVPVVPWLGVAVGGAWVIDGRFIGRSTRINAGVIVRFAPRRD